MKTIRIFISSLGDVAVERDKARKVEQRPKPSRLCMLWPPNVKYIWPQLLTDTFRRATGTRKNIFITMVTTHGIADNPYVKELVASHVEAEALFKERLAP